jgi:hypothetical protein
MPTYLFASENSPPNRSSLSTTITRVHDVTTPFVVLTTKNSKNVQTTSPHPSVRHRITRGTTNGMSVTCRTQLC